MFVNYIDVHMRKLFIIKTGTTFPDTLEQYGDFDVWTINSLGIDRNAIIVVDAVHGNPLPHPEECSGVVVSGSHSMVTEIKSPIGSYILNLEKILKRQGRNSKELQDSIRETPVSVKITKKFALITKKNN